jgi:hypothetical protein
VLLALFVATPSSAQLLAQYDYEDLEFRGIGLEGSRIWPARIEPTNGLALRLDLGLVGPRVRITPSARYWASTLNSAEVTRLSTQIILVCERQPGVTCPEELDLGEIKVSDLELTIDGHFLLLGEQPVSPYVGLGVALHLLNGSGDFIDDTFVEDLLDSVAPGIGPLGGIQVRLGDAIAIHSEARFMLASDVRYTSVGIGAVWTLPGPRSDVAATASPAGR